MQLKQHKLIFDVREGDTALVSQVDPRVLRTRKLIREAFRELLTQKGFDTMTIKDIAEKATINRATFYTHYEDKYALLEEITEEAFHTMMPGEVKNAQEFNAEICTQLILMTHGYIVDFYRNCRINSQSHATLVDEKIKRMLQQIIERIFLQSGESYTADPSRTRIISAMTGSAIYSAAYDWVKAGESGPSDALADIVRPFVMNGLGLSPLQPNPLVSKDKV